MINTLLFALLMSDAPMCQCPCPPTPTPVVVPTPTPTPKPTPTPVPVIPVVDKSCEGYAFDPLLPKDVNGWSIWPAPSRTIFVSKENVNKPASGTNFYVSTIPDGMKLLRKGSSDFMLLKRGETFAVNASLSQQQLGGLDSLHPMLIGSYGGGNRPILNVANGVYLINATGPISNFMMQSLDIRSLRTTAGSDAIRYAAAGGKNWIIEDVRIQGFVNNLNLDSQFDGNGDGIKNVQVRRSQFLDAYAQASEHSQNVYIDRSRGADFEENVFDHGGWLNRGKNPGKATMFNHNLYVQSLNKCFIFKNNVSMRASATGLQARAGGIVEDNFFLENPLHLTYGAVNGGSVDDKHLPYGVSGRVQRNVFINGTDIGPDPSDLRTGQIELGNILQASLSDNLDAHHLRGPSAGVGFVIRGNIGVGIVDLLMSGNIVYDLATKLTIQGNAWGTVSIKTDGSVWKDGKMVITAAASGMPLPKSQMTLTGQGLVLKDNIFQTGPNDFLNLSFDNPNIRVLQKQTAAVKFLEPNRQPAGFNSVGSYEGFLAALRDKSFDSDWSAKSINAWIKGGYQIIP